MMKNEYFIDPPVFTLDSVELDNKITTRFQNADFVKLHWESEEFIWLCSEVRNMIFTKFPDFCTNSLQPPTSLRKSRMDFTLIDIVQNQEFFDSFYVLSLKIEQLCYCLKIYLNLDN